MMKVQSFRAKAMDVVLLVPWIVGLWLTASAPAASGITHELLYAVTTENDLISFYADAPGAILNARAITGLHGSEEIRGIDGWTDGVLYGLGSAGNLYTIDPPTGAATVVHHFGVLDGVSFGFDNEPTGVRVVSELGQNLLVSRTSGAISSTDPVTQSLSGLAYDSAGTTMYAINAVQNTFGTLNGATGVYTVIGPLGIDVSTQNGLDVSSASGSVYLASPAASADPQANLYTVNKVTGAVTLVGLIGLPNDNILVRGLAVSP
jgi:hypothetical protein